MEDGAALQLLMREIQDTVRQARKSESAELRGFAEDLERGGGPDHGNHPQPIVCGRVTAKRSLPWPMPRVYLEMAGHMVVAWIWLRQALIAVAKLATAAGRRPRLLPGQAPGLRLLLPLGATQDPATEPAAQRHGPDLLRDAGGMVLMKMDDWISRTRSPAAAATCCSRSCRRRAGRRRRLAGQLLTRQSGLLRRLDRPPGATALRGVSLRRCRGPVRHPGVGTHLGQRPAVSGRIT